MRLKRIEGIAIIFGFVVAACQAQATNSNSLSMPQTSIAVITTQATDQTFDQATLAALPLPSPTSTSPAGMAACDTANLTGTAETNDATGAITFTVQIINQGPAACELQGQPQIQIVNQQSEPLVLQGVQFCFQCSPSGNPNSTQTPGVPATEEPQAATATAQAVLQEPIILPLEKSARVLLIWRNWCPPFPQGGVNLLMTLPGGSGELTIPTNARSGGSCDVPDAGSTLLISQFLPQ